MAKAPSLSGVIASAAVTAATRICREHPQLPWVDVRGALIYAAFELAAKRIDLWAAPLELVAPSFPISAAYVARVLLEELMPEGELSPEQFGHVHEVLSEYGAVEGVLVPVGGRKKGGVHFTPREMADKVTTRTLDPLLGCLRDKQAALTSADVLSLRVCDPACGAGAFLLSVVRQLGELCSELSGVDLVESKRLVATTVIRGVDKCPFAVYASKLALRLECRAGKSVPATWLDHAIKHGDALVGLDAGQVASFSWKKGQPEIPWLREMVQDAIAKGAKAAVLRKLDREAG